MFFILCSNKIFFHEKFLEAFEILIKKILNLKYTNYILLGSLYCSLNNIKFLEIETNLFMCITIFLFLVHLYNFILEYKYLKDTFLNTNKFKLVLIILIVISFFVVSFELYWFLDLFFSKFVILIKSFFKEILNGKGSGNNSPQGGSPPPSGNSLYAATGSNRSSSESQERYPEERPFLDLPQEIPKPLSYPENEIGLKGYGRKPYADTGIAVPANCVPVSNNSITLEDLSPSTS